jgi:hypothetical protein
MEGQETLQKQVLSNLEVPKFEQHAIFIKLLKLEELV